MPAPLPIDGDDDARAAGDMAARAAAATAAFDGSPTAGESHAAADTGGDAASAGGDVAAALASSAAILPCARWEQPTEPPPVRGASYFEDGKKVTAHGGPLCTLFATQAFEIGSEHLAGASARLLQTGALVPPRSAKFVLTVHFMTPRPSAGAKHHAIMAHAYATSAAEDAPGAAGELLRELWSGDAVTAITRCKVLSALRGGPHLVRATMAWMGLDATRPMLISRQISTSVNRATLVHAAGASSGAPATYQHVEIAFDCAASPLCNQMYKYAWPSLPSVDVSLTLLLEARTAAHLPEHPLAAFAMRGVEPSELAAQPTEWPTDPSQIPGEMVGTYTSGRAAADVGSWQSTRQILANLKSATKGGAKKGWLG